MTDTVSVGFPVRHRLPLRHGIFHTPLQLLHGLDSPAVLVDPVLDHAAHVTARRLSALGMPRDFGDFLQGKPELLGMTDEAQSRCIGGPLQAVAVIAVRGGLEQSYASIVAHHVGGRFGAFCQLVDG